jgi:hypothetical protein
VVAYLSKLSPEQRAALLARVETPDPAAAQENVRAPLASITDVDESAIEGSPSITDDETLFDLREPKRAVAKVTMASIPPPLPSRARSPRRLISGPRMSHPELVDAVSSHLPDLSFFETVAEAASFCLVTAMKVIPSLAGLALVRDDEQGGYIVVYAKGPRGFEVVRSRVPEEDPVVHAALAQGAPVAIEYGSQRVPLPRHAVFGDPWTVFVAAAESDHRCLATIELVDPIDGRALGESARRVLTTVTKHLAEFARARPSRIGNVFAPEQLGLQD